MHRSSIRLRAAASLIAVLGLVACSSDKKSSDTTQVAAETTATAAETAAPAAETQATETAAPAAETQAAAVTEAAAPASNEPQELTISYNKTGDWPEPEATLQAAKTGFEAANPGVKINLQSEVAADDAFRTKTQLRLQSGKDLPDIIPTTAGFVDADVKADYLLPIDSALDTWADWKTMYPEAIREGAKAFDGKTYFVPQASNDIGIWYNKDVFAKAGLPEKWEPQSWADLRTAAETIKAKVPGAIPAHLYAGKASGAIDAIGKTFLPLLYGTGDSLFDFKTNKWLPAGKGFVDSMTFMQDMYKDGLTAKKADVLSPNVWSFIGPWMKESKLGFVPDGNWMSFAWVKGGPNEWTEWGDRLGIATMPTQNPGGKVTIGYKGGGFAVVKGTKSPNLAMEFIKFASNKEISVGFSLRSGQLAVRTDVAADPTYADRPTVPEFSAMLQYAKYIPSTEESDKNWALLSDIVEKVAFNQLSPQEASDKYNAEMPSVVGKDNFAG